MEHSLLMINFQFLQPSHHLHKFHTLLYLFFLLDYNFFQTSKNILYLLQIEMHHGILIVFFLIHYFLFLFFLFFLLFFIFIFLLLFFILIFFLLFYFFVYY